MKIINKKLKIKVIYEDDNLLVLDKPAGLSVHADGIREEYTLADYIAENYPSIVGVGEDMEITRKQEQKIKPKLWHGQIEDPGFNFKTKKERIAKNRQDKKDRETKVEPVSNVDEKIETSSELEIIKIKRPGIVHRLDKDTGGCIIVAKNKRSFNSLKEQFQNKTIKKEYVALVYGWPKDDSGIIDKPIARSKADFRKKQIAQITKGGLQYRGDEREATTRYKVVKKLEIEGEKVALLNFYPLTGRMHQIRVHSKSIGHPIVGDHLYGYKNEKLEAKIFTKDKVHQLLHAKNITFLNLEGEEVKVESQDPFLQNMLNHDNM
jgi:RluA family pseudouridine synthase